MKRIAINGFGRIGRLTFRRLMEESALEVVAINDLSSPELLAHLLEYDSVHGRLINEISFTENTLTVDGKTIQLSSNRNPAELPWKELEVDVVLECTGYFRKKDQANLHIEAGAKRVIISAPPKSESVKTIVLGVNDDKITSDAVFFSNASCTTNCLAPMAKIMDDNFEIINGMMTTTHAYTSTQNLIDGPNKDLRRARAAAINIVPTSTGAATALPMVLPQIGDKIKGSALRVPMITGSLVELNCTVNKEVSVDSVNDVFEQAAVSTMKGIVKYSTEPIVSTDIQTDPHSCIFDAPLTMVSGNLVKIVAWYDNEYGYSSRLAELAVRVANL